MLSKPFVGRQELVDGLIAELSAGKHVAITGKQMIKAFQGMGGIGKTYLALKLAMELYDFFTGGIIRIDVGPQISDETSAQVPLSRLASYAFGGFSPLGSLQPEQVASWLAETAPGPLLVIFDDLWHPEPLRFLNRALPPGAVQLVTTRFTNVAQAIGAAIIPLDRLTSADGLALLEERLNCQGNPSYRPTLEALVKLLAGHAFALEIAAAQIKNPARLATVLHELDQGIGQGNLSSLRLVPGEGRDENLERSFALSYERLTPTEQRLFRALGVFADESQITADAVAAVWGINDINTAQKILYELSDLALLSEIDEINADVGGTRQHSLLRIYARALLEQQNELADASKRHAQFHTSRSWQAMSSSPVDYEFLEQHLPNILTALKWSERNDLVLFANLLENTAEFLLLHGQTVLLETYLHKAIDFTTRIGDKLKSANLHMSLGDLERRLGNLEQARIHYKAALLLYHAELNQLGEGRVYMSLGILESRLGNLEQARIHYIAALSLYRAIPDDQGEANLHMSLGILESRLDNFEQARIHFNAALSLYRTIPDHQGEANILTSLGDLESQLDKLD